MRFLCLHGSGTNSQVFETQLAAIRYEMDKHHEWEFVEGTILSEIDSAIKSFYPATDSYFQYCDMYSAPSMLTAIDQLDTYLETDGPFDGVIGFSQGAALAAMYLIQQTLLRPGSTSPLKFAIFFSGLHPFNPLLLSDGNIEYVDTTTTQRTACETCSGEGKRRCACGMGRPLITIPTAHIWGRNDESWPGASQALCDVCDDRGKNISLHDEGHDVPGAKSRDAVQDALRAIRRTIDVALMAQ